MHNAALNYNIKTLHKEYQGEHQLQDQAGADGDANRQQEVGAGGANGEVTGRHRQWVDWWGKLRAMFRWNGLKVFRARSLNMV